MLREQELSEIAGTYRDMASEARDPRFRLDFAERAERYETALAALRRARATRGPGEKPPRSDPPR